MLYRELGGAEHGADEAGFELRCTRCPLGCVLQVELDGDTGVSVSGNQCDRGYRYAESEALSPSRAVTGMVRVPGVAEPLSVRTDGPVPKDMKFEVLRAMCDLEVQLPVRAGDVLCHSICGLGVAVVVAGDLG